MSKYLFLDIDGVINPFKRLPTDNSITVDFGVGFGKHIIVVSPAIQKVLHSLIDEEFQIVWATTWCHGYRSQIEELAKAYGLPANLPKIDLRYWGDQHGTKIESGCGKLGGIIRWCQENNVDPETDTIFWFDDQLTGYDWEWADTYGVCAVKPNCVSGLRDRNALQKINSFKRR